VELASQLTSSQGPYSKSQIARAMGFARSSYYWDSRIAPKDRGIATQIEEWQEHDDTLGHRKLAVLLGIGKNRAKRVMHKYGIRVRRHRKKYIYPGRATTIAPNLVRMRDEADADILFSDIFEVRLADGSRVRGCFALRKQTRHILALVFDYRMQADLVVETIRTVEFVGADPIWHSDQGSQYGAAATRAALLEKGFRISMSRAGTPTDNGYAERFVGLFKLAVAQRRAYPTLGAFLHAAEDWVNFYNDRRPHESLGYQSPNQFAAQQQVPTLPYLPII
jgi:putative transposase